MIGAEKFGNAEVEQLRGALTGDEDVIGFEIPVDHQILMGVMHSGTNREEKLKAL